MLSLGDHRGDLTELLPDDLGSWVFRFLRSRVLSGAGVHWFRLFRSSHPDGTTIVEVLLDGEVSAEGQAEVAALDWPRLPGYWSARIFGVLVDRARLDQEGEIQPSGEGRAERAGREGDESPDHVGGDPVQLRDRAEEAHQLRVRRLREASDHRQEREGRQLEQPEVTAGGDRAEPSPVGWSEWLARALTSVFFGGMVVILGAVAADVDRTLIVLLSLAWLVLAALTGLVLSIHQTK